MALLLSPKRKGCAYIWTNRHAITYRNMCDHTYTRINTYTEKRKCQRIPTVYLIVNFIQPKTNEPPDVAAACYLEINYLHMSETRLGEDRVQREQAERKKCLDSNNCLEANGTFDSVHIYPISMFFPFACGRICAWITHRLCWKGINVTSESKS